MSAGAAEHIRQLIAAAPLLSNAQMTALRALIHNRGGRRVQDARPQAATQAAQATTVAPEPGTTKTARAGRAATTDKTAKRRAPLADRPGALADRGHPRAQGLVVTT